MKRAAAGVAGAVRTAPAVKAKTTGIGVRRQPGTWRPEKDKRKGKEDREWKKVLRNTTRKNTRRSVKKKKRDWKIEGPERGGTWD